MRVAAIILFLMFMFGIIAGASFSIFYLEKNNKEKPTGFRSYTGEKISPFNHVKQDQIKVYDDRVEIDFGRDVSWATYTNTNSMDPVLDDGHYGIEIIPSNTNEIHVGDIIAYKYGNSLVVHRIVEIGSDENGWYAVTKGDNNGYVDPVKVRFDMVKAVLAAIIY